MNDNILQNGRITAISVSDKKGIPKSNTGTAVLIENWGIEGDAHSGDWHRQISLLAVESINRMKEKGLPDLKPGIFAENITTEFINLPLLPIGSILEIGDNCKIEITQIGKECHSRCVIYETAGDCIMPKEGIFAKVVKGGIIHTNDEIRIVNQE